MNFLPDNTPNDKFNPQTLETEVKAINVSSINFQGKPISALNLID
jgi:hypothetical protein